MDNALLLLVLLMAALAAGWGVARWQQRRVSKNSLPDAYLSGLDYLIDNRTEEAIESFIEALEVNSDTLSAHIALAKLLRRKGDVDRAVRIHEKLLSRPGLSQFDRQRVNLALARDYHALGLLDRSEATLNTLLEEAKETKLRVRALRLLIRLYEQEGEWQRALDIAQQLPVKERQSLKVELSHYLCERAEQLLAEGAVDAARQKLEQALAEDEACVRANLALARILQQQSQWRASIHALHQVPQQDAAFVPETLRALRRAYEACDDESGFRDYLNSLQATHPSTSTMLALAEQKRDREGVLSAGLFITEALKVRPSVKGFNRLIDMHLEYGSSSARESLMSLRSLTQQLEISKPIYRCGQCGFSGRNLVWQCPSCRRWGSIRPIFGLEGE